MAGEEGAKANTTSSPLGGSSNVPNERRSCTRHALRIMMVLVILGSIYPIILSFTLVSSLELPDIQTIADTVISEVSMIAEDYVPGNSVASFPLVNTTDTTVQRFRCKLINGSTIDIPVFPHFIIGGCQKGGTSAVSKLLKEVPGLLRSTTFEPHFWSYRLRSSGAWRGRFRCGAIVRYQNHFDSRKFDPGVLVYEKTPILLALPRVPNTIREVLHPHLPKMVFILRDPVERFYSQYKMDVEIANRRNTNFPTLTSLIDQEIMGYHRKGYLRGFPLLSNITSNSSIPLYSLSPEEADVFEMTNYTGFLSRGFYSKQLEHYVEHFPLQSHLKVIHYENFTTNKQAAMNDLLQFIGAKPYKWNRHKLNMNFSPFKKKKAGSLVPEKLSNITRAYLNALYRPFNDELAAILGPAWRGAWNED